MKYLNKKLVVVLLATLFSCKTEQKTEITTTNYYFIRHAEKDRSVATNKDPHLTEIGKQRAINWKNHFQDVKFDNVYSTKYNRTIETATPTAKANNLEVEFYNPRTLYSEAFQNKTKGKTVLIVGHSNTTPAFVNTVLKENKYDSINDSINSNLYVVSISKDAMTSKVLTVN